MKTLRMTGRLLAGVLAVATCAAQAQSQASAAAYPGKPITIVVPYAAGGGADVIARALGKVMGESLKQPVVIDNKPGAAGQIAATAVSRATPDGYTLLLSTDNMYSINPVLFGKGSQDALAGLAPVSNLVGAPVVLAVNAAGASPVRSLADLIAHARAKGAPLAYASPGVGTPHQLIAESIAKAAGVKFVHVPYKGTSSAVADLMGGQVDVLFGMPATLQPLAAAGRLRIIAVTTPGKSALLPSVPTVSETYKGVAISSVDMGLMVPLATPGSVVQRLNEEVQKALGHKEVRAILADNAMVAMNGTPAEYAQRMKTARQERERIIVETGIKAE